MTATPSPRHLKASQKPPARPFANLRDLFADLRAAAAIMLAFTLVFAGGLAVYSAAGFPRPVTYQLADGADTFTPLPTIPPASRVGELPKHTPPEVVPAAAPSPPPTTTPAPVPCGTPATTAPTTTAAATTTSTAPAVPTTSTPAVPPSTAAGGPDPSTSTTSTAPTSSTITDPTTSTAGGEL